MNKYLFLFAIAITLGFTSCSEEECDHFPSGGVEDRLNIAGSWYEEVYNEEVHYYESGKFYDRFSNIQRCSEVEGAYEYNHKNQKLTYLSIFSGDNKVADYKVSDLSELGFTISSDIGKFNLEKIVETYKLEVGESTSILFESEYPSCSVLSYSSNNERLASVTSNGIITAEGEKGATYIKVSTAQGNVWVKVVVGDDCADLWFDYVSMIGMDYAEMKKTLALLGEPSSGEDGYSFLYVNPVHDIVPAMALKMNSSDATINEIKLALKDGVPESKVLSYLDSRYYKFEESKDEVYYSNLSDKKASKAVLIYDRVNGVIFIEEAKAYFNPPIVDLWTDFVPLFGMDKNYVKAKMDEYEYPFLMSDGSYSANGSDYYSIMDNEYVYMVGFVFNPDDVVSEYWVYMNTNSDATAAYNYLSKKYKENKTESTDKSLVFYDEYETLKVVLDLNNATTIYTNLVLRQHETKKKLWEDYTAGLGKTVGELVKKYGEPYYITDDESTFYYKFDEANLELCSFVFYKGAEKSTHISLIHNKELSVSEVVEYLGSLYTVFEKGTPADGSQYAWTDGVSLEQSTIGITYFPEDRMVMYQSLK